MLKGTGPKRIIQYFPGCEMGEIWRVVFLIEKGGYLEGDFGSRRGRMDLFVERRENRNRNRNWGTGGFEDACGAGAA